MVDRSDSWRVYEGDGVEGMTREERMANLKKRFAAVSRPTFVHTQRIQTGRRIFVVVLICALIFLVMKFG